MGNKSIKTDWVDWPNAHAALPEMGCITLWRVDLSGIQPNKEFLSMDEHLRVAALRSMSDQTTYVRARMALRTLLASCVQQKPQDILLGYTPTRKPSLMWPAIPHFSFSWAHTQQIALIALSRAGEIGVDIEAMPPSDSFTTQDMMRIAEQEFTDSEVIWLHAQSSHQRGAAFLRLWVRKEAYGKMCGDGLWGGMKTVQPIDKESGDAQITGEILHTGTWQDLPLPAGFIGALWTHQNSCVSYHTYVLQGNS